jgi:Trm5-related predicted tRNA methylase
VSPHSAIVSEEKGGREARALNRPKGCDRGASYATSCGAERTKTMGLSKSATGTKPTPTRPSIVVSFKTTAADAGFVAQT